MIFQYFSDLHLEKKLTLPKIKQVADNLILGGDIGYPSSSIYKEFIELCSQKYENVFLIDGNHEWDNGSKYINKNRFRKYTNVHLLENSIIELPKVVLLGSTLWTPKVDSLKNMTSRKFLNDNLELYQDKKKICITHHLPSYKLIVDKYKNLNVDRYANNLDYIMYSNLAPNYWICGHSHCINQKKIGNTICLINTFGEKYNTTISV